MVIAIIGSSPIEPQKHIEYSELHEFSTADCREAEIEIEPAGVAVQYIIKLFSSQFSDRMWVRNDKVILSRQTVC